MMELEVLLQELNLSKEDFNNFPPYIRDAIQTDPKMQVVLKKKANLMYLTEKCNDIDLFMNGYLRLSEKNRVSHLFSYFDAIERRSILNHSKEVLGTLQSLGINLIGFREIRSVFMIDPMKFSTIFQVYNVDFETFKKLDRFHLDKIQHNYALVILALESAPEKGILKAIDKITHILKIYQHFNLLFQLLMELKAFHLLCIESSEVLSRFTNTLLLPKDFRSVFIALNELLAEGMELSYLMRGYEIALKDDTFSVQIYKEILSHNTVVKVIYQSWSKLEDLFGILSESERLCIYRYPQLARFSVKDFQMMYRRSAIEEVLQYQETILSFHQISISQLFLSPFETRKKLYEHSSLVNLLEMNTITFQTILDHNLLEEMESYKPMILKLFTRSKDSSQEWSFYDFIRTSTAFRMIVYQNIELIINFRFTFTELDMIWKESILSEFQQYCDHIRKLLETTIKVIKSHKHIQLRKRYIEKQLHLQELLQFGVHIRLELYQQRYKLEQLLVAIEDPMSLSILQSLPTTTRIYLIHHSSILKRLMTVIECNVLLSLPLEVLIEVVNHQNLFINLSKKFTAQEIDQLVKQLEFESTLVPSDININGCLLWLCRNKKRLTLDSFLSFPEKDRIKLYTFAELFKDLSTISVIDFLSLIDLIAEDVQQFGSDVLRSLPMLNRTKSFQIHFVLNLSSEQKRFLYTNTRFIMMDLKLSLSEFIEYWPRIRYDCINLHIPIKIIQDLLSRLHLKDQFFTFNDNQRQKLYHYHDIIQSLSLSYPTFSSLSDTDLTFLQQYQTKILSLLHHSKLTLFDVLSLSKKEQEILLQGKINTVMCTLQLPLSEFHYFYHRLDASQQHVFLTECLKEKNCYKKLGKVGIAPSMIIPLGIKDRYQIYQYPSKIICLIGNYVSFKQFLQLDLMKRSELCKDYRFLSDCSSFRSLLFWIGIDQVYERYQHSSSHAWWQSFRNDLIHKVGKIITFPTDLSLGCMKLTLQTLINIRQQMWTTRLSCRLPIVVITKILMYDDQIHEWRLSFGEDGTERLLNRYLPFVQRFVDKHLSDHRRKHD